MPKQKAFVLALLLLSMGSAAAAEPSLLGASGGVLLPDTGTLPARSLVASGSAIWIDQAGETRDNAWYSLSAGPFSRLELGVSRVLYRTQPARDTLFHAKWQILSGGEGKPSLAVGAVDITGELTEDPTAYVVLGGKLWAPVDAFTGEPEQPLHGYVGWGSGIYGDSPFASLAWNLRSNTRLAIEWGKNSALGTGDYRVNLGVQTRVGENVAINAAAIHMRYPALGVSLLTDGIMP